MSTQIADEIARGDGIGAAKAARFFPPIRQGKPCHPATVTRRIIQGQVTTDGRIVRLEAIRVGGQWVTSAAAVRRFLHALVVMPGSASSTEDSARHEANERELASMGI